MKLLVVSMWPSAEAPERGSFVERQVAALRSLGHEVEVAPLTDIRTGIVHTPRKYARLDRLGRDLARRFKPDIVHGHFLVPTGIIAAHIARAIDVPCVVTAHGTDVANAVTSRRVRMRTASVLRAASGVIAVSDALGAQLQRLFPTIKASICDMGIDTTRFQPGAERAAATDDGSLRVLSVGSLTENKNQVALLNALALLPEATLTLVGEGPTRATLQARAAALDIADRVTFAGRVAPDELADLYRSHDASCLVSHKEGFGLAALEALACATPVVVSRRLPIAVCFEDGRDGCIVDGDDAAQVASAIRTAALLAIPASRATQLVAGRSVADRAQQTAEILGSVLALREGATDDSAR